MERATTTAAENIRATWLAPERASAPNTLITRHKVMINTANGIKEIIPEGDADLLKLFIYYIFSKTGAKLTINHVFTKKSLPFREATI
jgi:hypothetical protein